MLWSLKPPGFSSSPLESNGDGMLLLFSIVRFLCTVRVRAGWGQDPKVPGDDITWVLFYWHTFSNGIGVGGPPFPLIDTFFFVGAKYLPFPPLLASGRHLTAPATLG